jgi:hypothetical protein
MLFVDSWRRQQKDLTDSLLAEAGLDEYSPRHPRRGSAAVGTVDGKDDRMARVVGLGGYFGA